MGIAEQNRFKRDLRLAKRRGKDLAKLWATIGQLQAGANLAHWQRPHRLVGDWFGYWECKIESDWLLVWFKENGDLVLARTGTHADLFG